MTIQDIGNSIQNLFNGAGQAVARPIQAIQQFDQHPIQSMQQGIQNFGQYHPQFSQQVLRMQPAFNQVGNTMQAPPMANLQQYNHVQAPIPHFLANAGLGIAQDLINTPANYVKGIANTGFNIGKAVQGQPVSPLQWLGGAAPTANALLNVASFGVGGGLAKEGAQLGIKQALKTGAISGAKFGGAYGGLQGLDQNANNTNPLDALKSIAASTSVGALSGAALGGVTSGIGSYVGRLSALYQKAHPQATTQETSQAVQQFARDTITGRYIKNPQAEPAFYGDMRQAIGAPRNGDPLQALNEKNPFGMQAKPVGGTNAILDAQSMSPPQTEVLYHGTLPEYAKQIQKKGFDVKKSADGSIWFTNNKNALSSSEGVGTGNKGAVVERILPKDIKLVPEDKAYEFQDKYTTDQIIQMGYDGIKFPNDNGQGNFYQIYNPEKLQSQANQPKVASLNINDFLNGKINDVGKNNVANMSIPSQTPRGFTQSVQDAPNVAFKIKNNVNAAYTPKANSKLMGEAQVLLQDGAKIDLSKIQNADQKVAATIKQAISQQKTNPELAANLFNNLSEQGTELGRGVQAFSLLQKMSPESIALSAAGKIKQYNATAIRKIPELGGDQVKLIGDKVAQIQKLADGSREKNIAINELSNTINGFIPSSLVDKGLTLWKAGLLTSLRTHERNLLGNTIMGAAEVAKDPIASVADRLMSLKTGQRSMTTNVQGLGTGLQKGVIAAKDIMQRGYDPEQTIAKFDQPTITWGNNPLEQALKRGTDAVFRSLGGEDKPFLHGATARSLYDQAKTAAVNAGRANDQAFIQKLVANPTEQMVKIAEKDANYATFHDKSMLSNIANNIKRAASAPTAGVWGEFGKAVSNIIAPFTGVPSSIVGKTIDYSPIGLTKGLVNAGRVLAGQVPDLQRQASQEIGRGVIGTGLFGLGAYLMSKGLMTGQPKDAKEADLWAAQGKQANSVLVNGKWRSINSIGPQNLVMLAGAKYQEEMAKPDGSIGAYAGALGKDQLSQTFLAGVQGPLNAITDPARYGQSYIGNQSASLVPNIVKDTSKALDPNQRQNNSIKDYVTNSIPGLRNQNIVKRDVLGNPMKQEPTGVGAFLDLFNSKTPTQNPIANELARLDSTGNNATPSKMNASQTVYGQKVKLTPKQLDQAVSSFSPDMQQKMNAMIQSPTYQQLDDTQKAKVLGDIASGAKNNDMMINNILNGTQINQNDQSGGIPVVNSQGIQTSTVSKTSTLDKYQLQAAKDAFANGTDNFKDLGSVVLRKDAAGNVTAMTKDAFNTALYEATLTQAKAAKDSQAYQDTGAKLLDLYQKQLLDQNVDPLDKLTITNKMNSLSKALGIGLGSKPKKIGSIKMMSPQAIKPFPLKMSKAPKLKTVTTNMKIAGSKISGTKQTSVPKFKITNPRIYLSGSKGSQRGIRRAAGISVPVARRKTPVLTT